MVTVADLVEHLSLRSAVLHLQAGRQAGSRSLLPHQLAPHHSVSAAGCQPAVVPRARVPAHAVAGSGFAAHRAQGRASLALPLHLPLPLPLGLAPARGGSRAGGSVRWWEEEAVGGEGSVTIPMAAEGEPPSNDVRLEVALGPGLQEFGGQLNGWEGREA